MIGPFFSYFILFFLIARLTNLVSKVSWLPLSNTTSKQDAIVAVIFSIVVLVFIQFS